MIHMRFYKIYAMIYRDFLLYKRIRWKIFQFLYFPIVTTLVWGLFSVFARDFALEAGLIVLAVNILWSFASLNQTNINVNMMSDTWTGSFKQIILSGISEYEYIGSRIISSSIVSIVVASMLMWMSYSFFGLAVIYEKLYEVSILILLTLLSSIGLSVLIASMIIIMGRNYDFLSWTASQMFFFLSAPFYPVEIFPEIIQSISHIMPFTYIFIGMRSLATSGTIEPAVLTAAFVVSAVYFLLSLPVYKIIFNRARKTGQIVNFS
jgi:ABC-2 type transport system permease protein